MSDRRIALVHRGIRNVFGASVRNDFSPVGVKIGSKREQLATLWQRLGYRTGAEIGVWRGYFSSHILKTMQRVILHSIDPWEVYPESKFTETGQERNFAEAMRKLNPYIKQGRCILHKEYSLDAVESFKDGELDFVFIDGHHYFDHCVMDLIKWCPKVRYGGIVAVHDYCPMRRSGVIQAVDGYTKCHRIDPWYVIREDTPTAFWVQTETK